MNNKTSYTLQHIVDLNLAIDEVNKQGSIKQQQQLYAKTIAPKLKGLPQADKKLQGLMLWLKQYQQASGTQPRAWVNSTLNGLTWVLLLVMFVLGVGLVKQQLGTDKLLHVPVFLLFALGLPSLFLLATLFRQLLPNLRTLKPLLLRLVEWVAQPIKQTANQQKSHSGLARLMNSDVQTKQVLLLLVFKKMQLGAVVFYVALLLALMYYTTFYDVNFYWESTFSERLASFWGGLLTLLSLPWASWLPMAAPSYELIEQSQRVMHGELFLPSREVWPNFLAMTLLVWGLLPRLLLMAWFGWLANRQLKQCDFSANYYTRFWHQLSFIQTQVVTSGQQDVAAVLVETSTSITLESLRPFLLNKLRMRPVDKGLLVLDRITEEQWQQLKQASLVQLVVLCESWDLAPKRVQRLVEQLKQQFSEFVNITWLIADKQNDAPVPPDAAQFAQWQAAIKQLNDPTVDVIAYDNAL